MQTLAQDIQVNLDDCDIVNVRVTAPFRLAMRFCDGLVAELDFEDYVSADDSQFIAPLKRADYFAQVTIDDARLTWPNGYDLDPVLLRTWALKGFVSAVA